MLNMYTIICKVKNKLPGFVFIINLNSSEHSINNLSVHDHTIIILYIELARVSQSPLGW